MILQFINVKGLKGAIKDFMTSRAINNAAHIRKLPFGTWKAKLTF